MECGNLGRLAFVETERGMGKIQLASRVISSKVLFRSRCYLTIAKVHR